MSLCLLSYLGGMLDRASAISCGSDAVTCPVTGRIITLIIFTALLSPALIDAARRWPTTKNSNGQRRGGAALKNKSTGAPGWRLLLINNPAADNYSIFACSIIETSSAHTTTKGGLSSDLRGNRTSSGHPPPKNIRRITPQLPE